jgi:hypothetical protein
MDEIGEIYVNPTGHDVGMRYYWVVFITLAELRTAVHIEGLNMKLHNEFFPKF